MLFNTLSFAVFFTIVFLVYWIIPHKLRWPLLMVCSYYFYMCWNPKYVVLIAFTTIVSYIAALCIEKTDNKKLKKLVVTLTLIACFGVLFFFKYFNFTTESVCALLSLFSIKLNPLTVNLLLPVGISFYTFQTLGYVIDVYRGTVKAERNLGVYATFISFFPQLVAGPIERTENLLPQITSEKKFDYDNVVSGMKLMAVGFFKKMAIADVLSIYVDKVYAEVTGCSGLDIVVGVLFFTIQIYCDFSGYSDIAIGCARMLGINLMDNFKSPYLAQSMKEFWHRWHISLSTWFRDYLFYPLQRGNICGAIRKKFKKNKKLVRFLTSAFATMIVWFSTGIWHGANWTFVAWGLINGVVLIIEEFVGKSKKTSNIFIIFIRWLYVFGFTTFVLIFFRADNFNQVINLFRRLYQCIGSLSEFTHSNIGLSPSILLLAFVLIGILFVYDYFSMKVDVLNVIAKQKFVIRWAFYVAIVVATFFIYTHLGVDGTGFVYFQF